MFKDYNLHNEVTIIGRIHDNVKTIDNELLEITLAVPNDEDYESEPNIIKAYYKDTNSNMFNNIGQAMALIGHIESNNKLIIDVFKLI